MLQYQLNPHFLFNTLNSLRFVAAMHKDQIVSDGIQALSSLLQNTLTNKNEYITIQEELENLDGYETALLLIEGGGGTITPYGVVYDNGMKLSQLYDGRHFPEYFYESCLAL